MKISGALLAPSMRNPCSNSIRNIPQIPLPESPICYHEHYGFRCIRFSLLGFFSLLVGKFILRKRSSSLAARSRVHALLQQPLKNAAFILIPHILIFMDQKDLESQTVLPKT